MSRLKLEGVEYVSLTTNLWTQLWVHITFASSDWECVTIVYKHVKLLLLINLADELCNFMEEWDITAKVVMVTTDNALTKELSHLGYIGNTL